MAATELVEVVNQYKNELTTLGEGLRNRGQTITVELKQKGEETQQKVQAQVQELKPKVEAAQNEVKEHVQDMSPIQEHDMLTKTYAWTAICTFALMVSVFIGSQLYFIPLMFMSPWFVFVKNVFLGPAFLYLYQRKTPMSEVERRHFNLAAAMLMGWGIGVQTNNSFLAFWMPFIFVPQIAVAVAAGVLKLPSRQSFLGAIAGIAMGTYIFLGFFLGLGMGYLFFALLITAVQVFDVQMMVGRTRRGSGVAQEQTLTILYLSWAYMLIHILGGRDAETHKQAKASEHPPSK